MPRTPKASSTKKRGRKKQSSQSTLVKVGGAWEFPSSTEGYSLMISYNEEFVKNKLTEEQLDTFLERLAEGDNVRLVMLPNDYAEGKQPIFNVFLDTDSLED